MTYVMELCRRLHPLGPLPSALRVGSNAARPLELNSEPHTSRLLAGSSERRHHEHMDVEERRSPSFLLLILCLGSFASKARAPLTAPPPAHSPHWADLVPASTVPRRTRTREARLGWMVAASPGGPQGSRRFPISESASPSGGPIS